MASNQRQKHLRGRTKAEEKRIETAYRRRVLDLPHHRMTMDVGRIGYDEEGLRLTFAIGMPFDFHAEVQLSRADAESLIEQLRANLDDPRNANLPKGLPHGH